MSVFNRKSASDKRASLESFKATAEAASVNGSIHQITGGYGGGFPPPPPPD